MGGSLKGHSSSGGGNRGGNGRACKYGVMLVLAFGAAIFGVMVLHKLRDRRIFNLLLKQKDNDLVSLQLLLQKERDYSKELKRKNEETKAKINSLRSQKIVLDSRIAEMQSTISSLRDEQKTLELALEEKQKENKDKEMASTVGNQQVIALTEMLKQKEAEIDDLKHRLENPVNVWSVSTDDPSKSMAQQDKSETSGIKHKFGGLVESTADRDGENSMRGADGSGNETSNHRDEENSSSDENKSESGVGLVDRREMSEELSQKPEISRDDAVEGKKTGDSQDGEGLGAEEENKIANATHLINHRGETSQTREGTGDVEVMDAKDHENGQLEKHNFHDGERRKLGVNSKGGMKLDMPNNTQIGRVRGKHRSTSITRGKRWRSTTKNVRYETSESSEKKEDVSIENIQSIKEGLGGETYKRLRDEELEKLDRTQNHNMSSKVRDDSDQENGKLDDQRGKRLEMKETDQVESEERTKYKDSTTEDTKAVASDDEPQNSEGAENVIVKVRNTDINEQLEGQEVDAEDENSEKPRHSPDEVPKNRTVDNNVDGNAGDAEKERTGEAKEVVMSGSEQQTERRDADKADSNSKDVKVADEEQGEDDSEVTDSDTKEAETDPLRESGSGVEEDKESYNEQADEPEF